MRLSSTTEILAANGLYDDMPVFDPQTQQDYFDRGKIVGICCNWLARGEEPPKAFPEYDGYIDGYRLFLREQRFEIREWERELISGPLQFLSHPDQLGYLNGRFSLVEIKTGTYIERCYRLQTAGQQIAWRDQTGEKDIARFCLSLPGDGTYKLIAHTDPRDKSDFITMVQYSHLAMRLNLPVGIRLKTIMEERDAKRRSTN